jgi:hypothetical protein
VDPGHQRSVLGPIDGLGRGHRHRPCATLHDTVSFGHVAELLRKFHTVSLSSLPKPK